MFTRQSLRSLRSLVQAGSRVAVRRPVGAAAFARAPVLGHAVQRFATAAAAPASNPAMFCFQCEQTEHGTGCTKIGVCGKTPDVAAMQDTLVHSLKGLAMYAEACRSVGVKPSEDLRVFMMRALFSTLTNVNFDGSRFPEYITQTLAHRDELKRAYETACAAKGKSPTALDGPAAWTPSGTDEESLNNDGKAVGVLGRRAFFGPDVAGVQELLTYGLKGLCAYGYHAHTTGQRDAAVFDYLEKALAALGRGEKDLNTLLGLCLECGSANLRVMEMLDHGHTSTFGDPVPTQVKTTATRGKAILVSGHDIPMLEALLKQTEGTGINVYTHGELLPAHGYPALHKYKHLAGNYGGAWQLQKMEFSRFPGAILMTTNCIVEPRESYKNRIFTIGDVGWRGVHHLSEHGQPDFTPLIESARQMPGFTADEKPEKFVTVGFGRKTVLGVADKVIEAVQQGNLKRIVLIGGCDGSEGERNYYKQLAQKLPQETAILTLGCGKFRFNKLDLGTIPGLGLPRVLDMGQCNDAYGAIAVASGLAKALNTDVNSLPLSMALSWFEQKAVAVLLTLLSLGVKNIRIGPNLPAFVTPNVLNVLVDKFALKPVNVHSVEDDINKMFQGQ